MDYIFEAIYENGVLKPLDKPDIIEHQQVELLILSKEGLVTTPLSVLKVIDYLKRGPFPKRSPEEMGKDLEIDLD